MPSAGQAQLGASLVMDDACDEPERRLVAIMAADVVGFSRMMGADEAGTLAGLGRVRRFVIDPVIARHRGRIFKVMGDGLLTEFPSSMLALRAAVAIQTMLPRDNAPAPPEQRIVLRIGIHQGDVLVHGDDLLGDGVNIAARLESLAPHGGICVSARVREDAFGKVALAFEDGGERMLKNIARPMRVFFVCPGEPAAVPVLPLVEPDVLGQDSYGSDTTLYMPVLSQHHSLVILEAASPGLAPGHVVPLTGNPLTLGRQSPSGLLLPSGQVSRAHCRVELANGTVTVTDLRSMNGTFVDDRRIDGPTRLTSGATLKIGPYVIRYVLDMAPTDPDATQFARR